MIYTVYIDILETQYKLFFSIQFGSVQLLSHV